jgi:hypothetical protein
LPTAWSVWTHLWPGHGRGYSCVGTSACVALHPIEKYAEEKAKSGWVGLAKYSMAQSIRKSGTQTLTRRGWSRPRKTCMQNWKINEADNMCVQIELHVWHC